MTLPLPRGMTLVRELGRGRLGATALCRDAAGDEVVVTSLSVRPTDERARRELESEIHAAATAFDHPCAVRARVEIDVGGCWLLQPYLAGGSLGARVVVPDEVVVGGVRLATALAHAHAAGMLHGDVRPANVLRDAEGNWLLIGGGVAHAIGRSSSSPDVLVDPLFAAPEYFSGEQPGVAADVYSLGATLHAALVGRGPHAEAGQDGAGALYAARLGAAPELPLSVPAALAALVRRMLAPDPAERPALVEVEQVLRSLAPAGATLPPAVGARAVPPPPRPVVRVAVTEPAEIAAATRRRTILAAAAIGTVFLAGAGAVAATSGDEDEAQFVAEAAVAPTPRSAASAPAPAPAPKPSTKNQAPARPAADLTPRQLAVRPDYFANRYWLMVIFTMNSVPRSVEGWIATAYDPRTGALILQDEFAPTNRKVGMRGYRFHPDKVPLNACVTVETVSGSHSYPSARVCPDPKAVRKAQQEIEARTGTPVSANRGTARGNPGMDFGATDGEVSR